MSRHPRRALAALAALAVATVACGSDDEPTPSGSAAAEEPAFEEPAAAEEPATTDEPATTEESVTDEPAAEQTPAEVPADEQADTGAWPIVVPHAFGETTLAAEPQRVVAWGWGSADAAIAVGVVPVAIPFQGYGGDADGVLPWIRDAVGEELPTVLPESAEPPFEAIAAAEPDLILAVYSGITDDDYALLSAIAPTVAYPDQPWATDWRDLIGIVGTSLGRPDAAERVLTDIDAAIADAAAAHPELAGKTVAQVWPGADTFYVYEPADARVGFTLDLGLVHAPSVDELSTGESTFYFTLSHERLGELDSDILLAYSSTQEEADAFLASPAAQLMDQVREGRVAQVVGTEFIASVSPPTALSLTWGLDEYVAVLAEVAAAIDA